MRRNKFGVIDNYILMYYLLWLLGTFLPEKENQKNSQVKWLIVLWLLLILLVSGSDV